MRKTRRFSITHLGAINIRKWICFRLIAISWKWIYL